MMLQMQLITPIHFRIINEREALGFPVVNRSDWEAYRKAVIQKILLFNDGKTPTEIRTGVHSDRPDIALEVISELMNSIEFTLASDEVRESFIQLKTQYEQMLGGFPEQLPGLEQIGPPSGGDQQGGPPQGGGFQ